MGGGHLREMVAHGGSTEDPSTYFDFKASKPISIDTDCSHIYDVT